MINEENLTEKFVIDFMNIWFYKDKPVYEFKKSDAKVAIQFINAVLYGDEIVLAKDNINDIIDYLKKYCIIEESKTLKDIFFEGKMRAAGKMREAFNTPEVLKSLEQLASAVNEFFQEVKKTESEKISTDEIAKKNIFLN